MSRDSFRMYSGTKKDRRRESGGPVRRCSVAFERSRRVGSVNDFLPAYPLLRNRVGATPVFLRTATPLPASMSMPTSRIDISAPPRAPSSMSSLRSPRWPMRKTLPATSRGRRRRRGCTSDATIDHLVPSKPSGTTIALTVSEYHFGDWAQSFRPQASTARRMPSASRWWRAKTFSSPSSADHVRATRRGRRGALTGGV